MALTRASSTSLLPFPSVTPVIGIVTKSLISSVNTSWAHAAAACPHNTLRRAKTLQIVRMLTSRKVGMGSFYRLGRLFARQKCGGKCSHGDRQPERHDPECIGEPGRRA